MDFSGVIRQLPRLGWLCLFLLVTLTQPAFSQQSNDPQQLQKSGIAKIDHWRDYVRRTGDANAVAADLATAYDELKTSYEVFLQRKDSAGASWSAVKMGDILRFTNRWGQTVPLYQSANELAKRANRPDYQTKALARLAFSEMQIGEIDAAQDHARDAMRLGANCGNWDFYFEALDVAGEIEVKRSNLVAAGEYLDRALAMSGQIDDKQQLYLGYMDRGGIYSCLVRRKCG
jgi:tetratricopeptide (TPR) repeat protein